MKATVLEEKLPFHKFSPSSFYSSDVYRRESDRCHSLPFSLKYFFFKSNPIIHFSTYFLLETVCMDLYSSECGTEMAASHSEQSSLEEKFDAMELFHQQVQGQE